MISWYYMVVISLLLVSFLFWKEWKRQNKAMQFQRLLASLLAVCSLLLMAFPYSSIVKKDSEKNIALLTEGFTKDSFDYFLKDKGNSPAIFSADHSLIETHRNLKIHFITDLNSFTEKYKDDTIHVFGNGFNKEELDQLNNHSFIFHSNPVESSITSAYWKQQLKTGELFTIQGQYENVSAKEVKIILQAFNETVDSVSIPAKTRQDFSLNTIPKNSGKAVYTIIPVSGKDTLQHEPLPFEVSSAERLKILFLSSSPSFENTFLKNRLAQNGYSVTNRTTISKNKSDKQFLNMPEQPGDQLTAAYLGKFDVLIADDEALQNLNVPGLSAIRSAIEVNGSGLLIKMTSGKKNSSFYSRLFPVDSLKQDKKAFSIIHTAYNDSSNYKLKIEEPARIHYQEGTEVLLQDEQDNIVAAGAIYGNGKIVATTLNNTFSLALAGKNEAYQSIWSLLLQKTAKKIVPDETWQAYPSFPFVNSPVQLLLETSKSQNTLGQVGNNKIYLKQNPLLPYQYNGTYWPIENGWQSLIQLNGEIDYWYAYKESDWKKVFDFQKMKGTKKYAALHPASFTNNGDAGSKSLTPYLPLLFLIVFLISCAFLWIEQKSR